MIPYVEILNKNLKKFALIEPQECWFELSFFEIGEFEIYCRASNANLNALKKGNFVMIPNKRFIWYITSIQYTFTAGGVRMISAKGYEAKWLLYKRIIQAPLVLMGTITTAIYKLVNDNLGNTATIARQIESFSVDANELLIDISETQAPRGNLGEFVTNLLKTYNCGSQINYVNGGLKFTIINGSVKTQRIMFSQSYDNLLSSTYNTNDDNVSTYALVVSTVNEVDYTLTHDMGAVGIDRNEILINSNLSTKYEDADGVEKETTPDSDLYKRWQNEEAKNELTNHKTIEEVSGDLDLAHSKYEFDKDFYLGDLVKVTDEYFKYSYNTRILKYTFKQDANGYGEEAEFGGD